MLIFFFLVEIFFDYRRSLVKVLLILAITHQAHSVVLTCYFYNKYLSNENRYICAINFGGSQSRETTEVTEIIGNHTFGKTNNDVKVYESYDQIKFLPKGLEKFFPNLNSILLYNSFNSISSADLAPWPNLILFSYTTNPATSIDGDLFKNSLKLRSVEFKSNYRLENVGANLLSNLNELTLVDFRGNLCINITATTPEQIENLKAKLITQCPPLRTTEEPRTTTASPIVPSTTIPSTTTESDQCLPRCSLNEETDALRQEANVLREGADALRRDLATLVVEHISFKVEQVKSIKNLENLVNELTSGRCKEVDDLRAREKVQNEKIAEQKTKIENQNKKIQKLEKVIQELS